MKEKNTKNNQGQILIITLLILLVLSIVVLSTVVNLSRDVRGRVNNELYEENYSNAEARLLQTAEYFDDFYSRVGANSFSTQDINDLENKLKRIGTEGTASTPSCSPDIQNPNKIVCEVKEGEIVTDISIEQKNQISDFEMTSNDVLQLNLTRSDGTSYTNSPIRWQWSGNVSWSLTLIYEKNYNGQIFIESVKDVYNVANSTSTRAFNFSNTSNANFAEITNFATTNDTKFSEGSTKLLYFRIRPIITSGSDATTISLSGDGTLPVQFVEINAQSYQEGLGQDTPTPLLSIKKPIVPAPPALFDYVYYTNRSIQ